MKKLFVSTIMFLKKILMLYLFDKDLCYIILSENFYLNVEKIMLFIIINRLILVEF